VLDAVAFPRLAGIRFVTDGCLGPGADQVGFLTRVRPPLRTPNSKQPSEHRRPPFVDGPVALRTNCSCGNNPLPGVESSPSRFHGPR
jgi:hypothetical protein